MEIKYIPLIKIKNPDIEMREEMSSENLEDLGASIKKNGLINPVIVKQAGNDYEIIAGYRRTEACRMLGLTEIACRVLDRHDADAEELKIHENLHREEVNPADEALYYKKLLDKKGYTLDDIVRISGKGRGYIEGRFEITKWEPFVIAAVQGGKLTIASAREIQKFPSTELREMYAKLCIENGGTSRTILSWRKQWLAENGMSTGGIMDKSGDLPVMKTVLAKKDCVCCNVDLTGQPLYFIMLCGRCDHNIRNTARQVRERQKAAVEEAGAIAGREGGQGEGK